MNTVILTLVLFFNGTTHIVTHEYGIYGATANLRLCWRKAEDSLEGFADTGVNVLSVQCTVKKIKGGFK